MSLNLQFTPNLWHFILENHVIYIIHLCHNYFKIIIVTEFMSFYIRKSCKFMSFIYVTHLCHKLLFL